MTVDAAFDKRQDRAVEASFPASDPPANSGITGAKDTSKAGEVEPIPTGTPTSDRHAAETAHHDESDVHTTKDVNSDAAAAKTRSSSRP